MLSIHYTRHEPSHEQKPQAQGNLLGLARSFCLTTHYTSRALVCNCFARGNIEFSDSDLQARSSQVKYLELHISTSQATSLIAWLVAWLQDALTLHELAKGSARLLKLCSWRFPRIRLKHCASIEPMLQYYWRLDHCCPKSVQCW